MKCKQGQTVYLMTSVGNLDDTIEIEEDVKTYQYQEKALVDAKQMTEEYGCRTYVYRCVPIIRVDKGKIRVTTLKGANL